MSVRVILGPNEDGNYAIVNGVVRDYFSGAEDVEKDYSPHTMIGFAIVNTGAAELTFEINGMTIPVDSGETWEDCFEPFKTVKITATDTFKAVVKG